MNCDCPTPNIAYAALTFAGLTFIVGFIPFIFSLYFTQKRSSDKRKFETALLQEYKQIVQELAKISSLLAPPIKTTQESANLNISSPVTTSLTDSSKRVPV